MKKYLLILSIILFSASCDYSSNDDSVKKNDSGEKTMEITYCNYEYDKLIEKYSTEQETIDYFKQLPRQDGSFLTIGIAEMQIIQFAWSLHTRKCLVEITNVGDEKIYKQRYADYEECVDLIKAVYAGKIMKAEGFVPVNIVETTLDQVLKEMNDQQ